MGRERTLASLKFYAPSVGLALVGMDFARFYNQATEISESRSIF